MAKLDDTTFAALLRHVIPREQHTDKRISVEHTVGNDVLGAIRALLDQQGAQQQVVIDVEARPAGSLPSPTEATVSLIDAAQDTAAGDQVQAIPLADGQPVAGEPGAEEPSGHCAPSEPAE